MVVVVGGGGGICAAAAAAVVAAAAAIAWPRGGMLEVDMPGSGWTPRWISRGGYTRAGMGPSGARWNGANRTGNWNGRN